MSPTIDHTFLMRARFYCRRAPENLTASSLAPEALGAEWRVPRWTQYVFSDASTRETSRDGRAYLEPCGICDANRDFFDFRTAWSPEGFALTVVVAKKSEQKTFANSELDSADQIRVCLDARDLKEVKRGTRFCYKFVFFPTAVDARKTLSPKARQVTISRAREQATAIDAGEIALASELRADGYAFSAFFPAQTLVGYEPDSFNRLGLHFAVTDGARGVFALQHYAPTLYEEDPSLWPSFLLV